MVKNLLCFVAGFLLGATVLCVLFACATRMPPPTPTLRPPTAIRITLYPWLGRTDCRPVDIPPERLDLAFRLLTPDQFFGHPVYDFVTPIVAEAVLTHEDGTRTSVMVRDHGHNPAVVSLDGWNYFYARNDPDVHAGAIELIRLVNEVARPKQAEQPEP